MNVSGLAAEILDRPRRWFRMRRIYRRLRARYHGYYRAECARLDSLRDRFGGRRAFLVGSGPSLSTMDLEALRGEFICTVNLGIRGIGTVLPHVDMHVVLDGNALARYAGEFGRIAQEHSIPYRFRKWADHDIVDRPTGPPPPYFVLQNKSIKHGITNVRAEYGLTDGGSTVLIDAAQLLFLLGFVEVYVLGCDLSYGEGVEYFYALNDEDLAHEADPSVITARQKMYLANAHFAHVRKLFETNNRKILNAGRGGNLTTLERVDFESLVRPR